jgi:hypothetical protein
MSKSTHIGRVFGSLLCKELGCSDASIDQQGKTICLLHNMYVFNTIGLQLGGWTDKLNAKDLSYHRVAPVYEAMRVYAGFQTREAVWYQRDGLDPPQVLLEQVFPWLSDMEEQYNSASFEQRSENKSGHHLIRVLQILRVVLLQDAVVLQTKVLVWYL